MHIEENKEVEALGAKDVILKHLKHTILFLKILKDMTALKTDRSFQAIFLNSIYD